MVAAAESRVVASARLAATFRAPVHNLFGVTTMNRKIDAPVQGEEPCR